MIRAKIIGVVPTWSSIRGIQQTKEYAQPHQDITRVLTLQNEHLILNPKTLYMFETIWSTNG